MDIIIEILRIWLRIAGSNGHTPKIDPWFVPVVQNK